MTDKNQSPKHMSLEEFRSAGYETIDWLVDYMADIEKRPISAKVSPGDIKNILPKSVPEHGETYSKILGDMQKTIVPGLTLWQHPGFYGYFAANSSPPAILADLLSTGLGVQGMLWATGPSVTELEIHVLDLIIDLCGLPKKFRSTGTGGGVIQDSASSATLCAVIAARKRAGGNKVIKRLRAYISTQAHSSVEKDLLIVGLVPNQIRKVKTNSDQSMSTQDLEELINEDLSLGLIPFFVVGTVGTTSSGAIDDVKRISHIASKADAWVHVDAAWAGSAAVCPEYRYLLDGLDLVDSYVFNPHKWLLTNFDCSVFFVADSKPLTEALSIVPEYLKNSASETGEVVDYRDWQVPLGRRFRSLKLWFVLRSYGVQGLRAYIRQHIEAATYFEKEIEKFKNLTLATPRSLSLVCFRHVESNKKSEILLKQLNSTGKVLLTHTIIDGMYIIRVAVGGTYTTKLHLRQLVTLIKEYVN